MPAGVCSQPGLAPAGWGRLPLGGAREWLRGAAAPGPWGAWGKDRAPEPLIGRSFAFQGGGVRPDLEPTPEEKRVLERKLKKERRREERKRLREAGAAPAQPPRAQRSGAQLALDYLCG